jgi:hypothetical protein
MGAIGAQHRIPDYCGRSMRYRRHPNPTRGRAQSGKKRIAFLAVILSEAKEPTVNVGSFGRLRPQDDSNASDLPQ